MNLNGSWKIDKLDSGGSHGRRSRTARRRQVPGIEERHRQADEEEEKNAGVPAAKQV